MLPRNHLNVFLCANEVLRLELLVLFV